MRSVIKYRPDIDGLRAIAVSMVVVFHFQLGPAPGGFSGVDVFFVISGFLITSIILEQMDAGVFSFKVFYTNRIRRLSPAFFVTLAASIAAGTALLFPSEMVELSKEALASLFYVSNIYFWRTLNYFSFTADRMVLLHTWSLSVEEQFYLLFPLTLLMLHRYARGFLWPLMGLLLTASFALNIGFIGSKPEATFYLLPTRGWELFLGAFVVRASLLPRSEILNEALCASGGLLILIGFFFFNRHIQFPGYFALLPTFGTAMLILSGGKTVIGKLLSSRPIIYVGKISYPLYLVHWPINAFAKFILGDEVSVGWRAAMLVLSFASASLIYHCVERPIQSDSGWIRARISLRNYILTCAISASILSTIFLTGGLPGRFSPEVARLAGFVDDRQREACEYAGTPLKSDKEFCRIGEPTVSPTWMIYGDSHAFTARPAFDLWLRNRRESALFIWRGSCPPIRGLNLLGDRGLCVKFNESIVSYLETKDEVKNVFLVSAWRIATDDRLATSSDMPLTREMAIELFKKQFPKTVSELSRAGRRVYVWEPIPGAKDNVPITLAKATADQPRAESALEFDVAEYRSRNEFFFDALKISKAYVAGTFSPSLVLCSEGRCMVTRRGDPVYFDSHHITLSSASFWSDQLRKQMPSR